MAGRSYTRRTVLLRKLHIITTSRVGVDAKNTAATSAVAAAAACTRTHIHTHTHTHRPIDDTHAHVLTYLLARLLYIIGTMYIMCRRSAHLQQKLARPSTARQNREHIIIL